MQADEALLIKTFDSSRDGRATRAIHSAFTNPLAAADAPEIDGLVYLNGDTELAAGDTVVIESGKYDETIRPARQGQAGAPITYRGAEGAVAIIEEGKADAQKVKDSIVQSAKKDAQDIMDRSRREIEHDLNNSLKNLQTDIIDLYWLHRDDPHGEVGEIIGRREPAAEVAAEA